MDKSVSMLEGTPTGTSQFPWFPVRQFGSTDVERISALVSSDCLKTILRFIALAMVVKVAAAFKPIPSISLDYSR